MNACKALLVIVLSVFEESADEIVEGVLGQFRAITVALFVVSVYCCFEFVVKREMFRRDAILSFEREMGNLLLFLALLEFDLQLFY